MKEYTYKGYKIKSIPQKIEVIVEHPIFFSLVCSAEEEENALEAAQRSIEAYLKKHDKSQKITRSKKNRIKCSKCEKIFILSVLTILCMKEEEEFLCEECKR